MHYYSNEEIQQPESPRANANFLSICFFWWINPLLRKGYKKELELKDIHKVLKDDSSKKLGDKLCKNWEKERKKSSQISKKKPNLLSALACTFGLKVALLGIGVLFEESVLGLLQPIFMSWFIMYFSANSDEKISYEDALLYGCLTLSMSAVYAFTVHFYFLEIWRTGMQIRVALCSMIYRKALRLSQSSLNQNSIGKMANLISNDVARFHDAILHVHYLYVGPAILLGSVTITWHRIGTSTLAGALLILAFVPLQGWSGKVFSRLRMKTATKTDFRIKTMGEILNAIKVIKMYAWEYAFSDLISTTRREEIKVIRDACYYRSFNFSFFFVSNKLILLALLVPWILGSDRILNAGDVFFCLAVYDGVRFTMTLFFPMAIADVSESYVSIKRIEDFLLLEERDDATSARRKFKTHLNESEVSSVIFESVCAKWDRQSNFNTLNNVSFSSSDAQLVAMIGTVGGGKSSILQAILGEMPLDQGEIKISGSLSYSSQEPWVFFGSVRHNILFGEEFDEERYWKVIKVCALDKDLQGWEHGDSTLVGEKGVMLSGGQKARVNLARAIYRNADIYLLDDPLSAVDSQVGKHLFTSCIKEFLKNKLVILVTHQLQYLKTANQIIVINKGSLEASGSFKDIQESDTNISEYFIPTNEQEEEAPSPSDNMDLKHQAEDSFKQVNLSTDKALELFTSESSLEIEDESRNMGRVSYETYWHYFSSAGSTLVVPSLILMNSITQVMYVSFDLWLAHWTNMERHLSSYNATHGNYSAFYVNLVGTKNDDLYSVNVNNFIILLMIAALLIVFSGIRTLQHYLVCMKSSNNLHNAMFYRILRAPLNFFNLNPIGRILNRFSKDMGSVDEILPKATLDVISIYFAILGVFFIVVYHQPYAILPTVIIFVTSTFIKRYYLSSSRAIKRLEGVSKSPMFSQFSYSLQGLTTIRSCNSENLLQNEFDKSQDLHTSTWYALMATNRWFGLCLDWSVTIFFALCIASLMWNHEGIFSGDAGVILTSCLTLNGMLQYGMERSAEVENLMTSVERIFEYGKLESEADLKETLGEKNSSLRGNWPNKGIIEFKDVFMKYKEDQPYILKNITFKTNQFERIGVVGRTGAGKSSIIAALLRLTESEGSIFIDDQSIFQIGLHDLRKNVSIIPQDPILFAGTLRYNLDPFNEFDDVEIWNSLRKVSMDKAVQDMNKGLQSHMSEGGSNLSVGQKQLICLARAILRRNKILIMDEATANVDPRTDSLIQETIRNQFNNLTVITIAHRLQTVMDSDRIMVIHDGSLVEFDVPHLLLRKKNNHLSRLLESMDKFSKEELHKIAKLRYKNPTQNNMNGKFC